MIDPREALDAVIRHASDLEDDYDLIAPTVRALSDCGDVSLVPRLEQALDEFLDEENFYGRDLVAGILAGIQGPASLATLLRASARDLGDDQDGLQAEVVGVLEADRVAGRTVVVELLAAATPELRRTALWALGFVGDDVEDFDLLAAAAIDPDSEVRSMTIGSLANPAGNDRAFDVIVQALGDPDEQVRVTAVSRLGYSGRTDAIGPLTTLAADPAIHVRSMVAYALGQLGSAEATPTLLRLFDDADQNVRTSALDALGRVGGPAAVDVLIALAADASPRNRALAAKALAKAAGSDPRAGQHIAALARDDDPAVRAATLSGLATVGDASAQQEQILLEAVDDPNPVVRQRVAVVARHLAPRAVLGILKRYSGDPDPVVRKVASTELARINDAAL